jgi:uncharacterized SAM-binding protein YcdF (DUF218 family)
MSALLYESLCALLEPIGLIWAVLLAMAVWQFCKGRRGGGLVALLLAVFIYLVGATSFPAWLLAGLERPYDPLGHRQPKQADAVVMLGGTHTFTQRSPLRIGVGEADHEEKRGEGEGDVAAPAFIGEAMARAVADGHVGGVQGAGFAAEETL